MEKKWGLRKRVCEVLDDFENPGHLNLLIFPHKPVKALSFSSHTKSFFFAAEGIYMPPPREIQEMLVNSSLSSGISQPRNALHFPSWCFHANINLSVLIIRP